MFRRLAWRSSKVAGVIVAGSLFCVSRASAGASGHVSLVVERAAGTETCIDRDTLVRAVESRLHRPLFTNGAATLAIRVQITHAPGEWSEALMLLDAQGVSLGERTLTTRAAHCSALDDSVALVVALLVDSPTAQRALAAAPQPENAVTAAATNSAPDQPGRPAGSLEIPQGTHAPREPWHSDIAFAASASAGILPGIAFGAIGSFGLKLRGIPELRLGVGAAPERETTLASRAAGARLRYAEVELELCPWSALGAERVHMLGCLGQVLGRLHATAFGFGSNGATNLVRYALVAHAGMAVSLSTAISLRFLARGELPLSQSELTYGAADGSDHGIFRTSRASGTLELGAGIAWR